MKKKLKKAQTGVSVPTTSPEMRPDVANVNSYRDSSAINNNAFVQQKLLPDGELRITEKNGKVTAVKNPYSETSLNYARDLEMLKIKTRLELAKAKAAAKFEIEKMKNK